MKWAQDKVVMKENTTRREQKCGVWACATISSRGNKPTGSEDAMDEDVEPIESMQSGSMI